MKAPLQALRRMPDPRVDYPSPPHIIYGYRADESEHLTTAVRLDSWILDQGIAWLYKDREYWKTLFRRAEEETFVPGTRVFFCMPGLYDCYSKTGLHVAEERPGERDSVHLYLMGLMRVLMPQVYTTPEDQMQRREARTSTQWLKHLRFLARKKANDRKQNVRRRLEDYPPRTRELLQHNIQSMTRGLECVDNIRIAEAKRPGECRRYYEKKSMGCCGSKDTIVRILGKDYLIGCNYGH